MANGELVMDPSQADLNDIDPISWDDFANLNPMSLCEAFEHDLDNMSPQGGEDSNSDGRSDGGQGQGGGGGGGDGDQGPQPPQRPNGEEDQGSPLVFDLDNDGVELYALADYGTYFDLRGNGQAVLTGWVEPDDGLLALDVNANGTIDGITELFGTLTTDGFTVLAAHDANDDGVINSSDTVFDDLLIWTDTNSDGISQESELHTLASLDITSINLAASRVGNEELNGNIITHESTFTMGGIEQTVVDAWFTYDTRFTHNVADYDFDIRAAFLPTLRGFGDLKDLHIAASIDNGTDPSSIMEQLSTIAASTALADVLGDWESFKGSVEDILFAWAGVESVSPTSRGSYVDGQHLAFNEAFKGEAFSQYGSPNPLPEAGEYSEAVYQHILTNYAVHIFAQLVGSDIFEGAYYNLYTAGIQGDLDLVQAGIDAVKDAAIAAAEPSDVWTQFAQFLGYTKGLDNLTVGEIAALDTAVAATSEPGLSDWQDVVSLMTSSLGGIIDSSDDWGSFEIFYDNLVTGTSGDDTITDSNAGGFHNNEFQGLDGNDTINALDGHDKLIGGAGNDTLNGGSGDDYMLGGIGDDIYQYDSGNDTVSEVGGSGYDEIHVVSSTGLTTANVTDLYRYGNELIVLLSTGSLITIDGYGDASAQIEKIVFDSNSSIIDLSAIIEQKFYGTALADTLIVSGTAVQTLLVYGYGSNDTITADGAAAKFYGGDGYDTLIGDYLPDFLYGENNDDYLFGEGGNDTLTGGAGNDRLLGGDGADTLYGSDGNDVHDGGAGNDRMEGGNGNDTYVFGLGYGQDVIRDFSTSGGSADDKITFLTGIDPGDVIVTRTSLDGILLSIDGTTDSLTIENQNFYSFDVAQIESVQFADNTVWTAQDLREMAIATATTTGNDTITGWNQYDDVIEGGLGNDTIDGQGGSDSYIFNLGDGQDILSDSGGFDSLTFMAGIDPGDVVVTRGTNASILLSITGTTDSVLFDKQEYYTYNVYRIDEVNFADSTTWDEQDLRDMAIASQVTSGNDTVVGFRTGDTIMGGAGNDLLQALEGDDTYIYNLGDGQDTFQDIGGNDVIKLGAGIALGDLSQSRVGNDLVITISAAPSSSITVKDHYASSSKVIEKIIFDDNSELNIMPQIVGTSGNDTLSGTTGADLMLGRAGNDTISAGFGNDEVLGEEGNDTIYGGYGNDVLYGNEGSDAIYGEGDNDEIYGDDGDDTLDGGNGIDTLYGGVGNDTLYGGTGIYADTLYGGDGDDNIDGGSGNDTLYGDEGSDILDGGSGADTVYGGTGNDILYGGDSTSADTLYGEDGNDTYRYQSGDGADTITDTSGSLDIIQLLDNVGPQSLTFSVINTDDLKIAYSSTYYMVLTDQLNTGTTNQIENLVFQDGFWLDLTTYNSWVIGTSSGQTMNGTTGADTILGRSGNDIINGSDGDDHLSGDIGADTLNGGIGADYLHGGSDNDTLYGDSGNDFLYGFTGTDALNGGDGNDTLSGGDGVDTIHGNNDNDILKGGAGADVLYGDSGADIFLFEVASAFSAQDTISDFNAGQDDAIDISNLLVGYDPNQSAIDDFVTFTTSGSNTIMAVDRDGTGGTYSAVNVATISGATGLDADDLLANGNLIAV
ncbi:MAG: calcium-binding protein [Alphaproteobacteria bacterium]